MSTSLPTSSALWGAGTLGLLGFHLALGDADPLAVLELAVGLVVAEPLADLMRKWPRVSERLLRGCEESAQNIKLPKNLGRKEKKRTGRV